MAVSDLLKDRQIVRGDLDRTLVFDHAWGELLALKKDSTPSITAVLEFPWALLMARHTSSVSVCPHDAPLRDRHFNGATTMVSWKGRLGCTPRV